MKYTSREDLNMGNIDAARAMYGGAMGNMIDAAKRNDAMEEAIKDDIQTNWSEIFGDVLDELVSAVMDYPSMVSAHEGFAILKEEVDELWDAVRVKQSDPERVFSMRAEAVQVAAMALRFLHDVCGDE